MGRRSGHEGSLPPDSRTRTAAELGPDPENERALTGELLSRNGRNPRLTRSRGLRSRRGVAEAPEAVSWRPLETPRKIKLQLARLGFQSPSLLGALGIAVPGRRTLRCSCIHWQASAVTARHRTLRDFWFWKREQV